MPVTVSSPQATPEPTPAAEPAPAQAVPDLNAPGAVQQQPAEENFVLEAFGQLSGDREVEIDLPPDPTQVGEVEPANPPAPAAQPAVVQTQPVAPAVEPSPAAATPAPAEPVVAPQPAAPAQPAAAAVQPAAPAVTPPVAQQTPAQPAPVAPQEQSDPFKVLNDQIAAREEEFINVLAEKVYAVKQEDIDAFIGGDGKKISLAMARVHTNSVRSVLANISAQMPIWLNGLLAAREMHREAEDAFWQANPYLDRKNQQHVALVGPVAQVYMKTVPNSDVATRNRTIGMMVAAQLGLPIQGVPAPAGNGHQPVPARPAVATPGPVVRSVPQAYAPAGVQTAAPGHQAPTANQWDDATRLLMADQMGLLDE